MITTNEMRILREFLQEFNPICTEVELNQMSYRELVSAIQETVKEM